jgi:hypothetical protein
VGTFLVVLAALQPSGDSNLLQLDASLQLDTGSVDSPLVYSTNGGWLGADVAAAVAVFGRRVRDDEAAPPLQPFLQRAPRYSLEVAGGGVSVRNLVLLVNPLMSSPSPQGFFTAEASASGYLLRWIYLGGGLALRDNIGQVFTPQQQTSNELLVTPWLVLGARWEDTLFFAGYGVTPVRAPDGTTLVRFWGNAWVGAHTVFRRFVDVNLRVDVLDGGAVADAGVDVWLRRRFAVGAGMEGGRGAFANSAAVYDRAGGRASLSYWLSARVGFTVAYTVLWLRVDPNVGNFYSLQHLLAFAVHWRPNVPPAIPAPEDDEPMKR